MLSLWRKLFILLIKTLQSWGCSKLQFLLLCVAFYNKLVIRRQPRPLFCYVFRRSDTGHNRWVSPHSEGRSIQPHNDALPEAEAQEHEAEEGAEADRAPPPDPGPDCLTGGRVGHKTGQSCRPHTARKYFPQLLVYVDCSDIYDTDIFSIILIFYFCLYATQ